MKENVGVINPNPTQVTAESLQFYYFSLAAGIVTSILVMILFVWILKKLTKLRTSIASVIASFYLSLTAFCIFIVFVSGISQEYWIVSSTLIWAVTFVASLFALQPPSFEQMLAKTKKEVSKLEHQVAKQEEKEFKKKSPRK